MNTKDELRSVEITANLSRKEADDLRELSIKLGEPDGYKPNPNSDLYPIHVYNLDKVEQIEASEAFQNRKTLPLPRTEPEVKKEKKASTPNKKHDVFIINFLPITTLQAEALVRQSNTSNKSIPQVIQDILEVWRMEKEK